MKSDPGGVGIDRRTFGFAAAATFLIGSNAKAAAGPVLEEIASADRSWVQVAVAPSGRVFLNFSRWFGPLEVAVAEVLPGRRLRPYPDAGFNRDTARPASERAVSVQSVHIDPSGRTLWIVDSGNPGLGGAITGGARLVEVSLATNRIVRTLPLNDVIGKGGYLADVRFHASRRIAVLPDLASGALAVVDLTSGGGRRVLEGHISTQAEDITLNFGGKPWLYADGSRPRTAATSLAFSPDGRTLYFKALIGRRLYSVPTSALMAGNREAASAVRPVVLAHPTDAIAFGPTASCT
jgi:hypothetical protein